MTVDKKELVTTIAFMIGVRRSALEQCFGEECRETIQMLNENQPACIIRYLCKLRTTLMYRFKKTDDEMRFNLKNLDRLEWYDLDNIKQLEKWGIQIIQSNYRAEKYMTDFNRLISEHIDSCSGLFNEWINWSYIRELFCIPKYSKPGVMKQEFEKFMEFNEHYPFQMYIYWKPKDLGNILYTDGKFLSILYNMHNDFFSDVTKYKDAHSETKNSIYDFVNASNRAVIAVDCENSDVYKLYSALKNLNSDELSKIDKIILYDDYHTSLGWDWLEKFTRISVEHIEVERVTDRKSLVDIKMTAGICKNYYEDNVDSFILVSSDSDYWGLISSLPKANFLIMYEYGKCGTAIKNALDMHDIYYCSIDDFCSGNIEDLKRAVLFDILEKYIPDIVYLNGYELASKIFEEARIQASQKEIENFYSRYIKTLRLKCDAKGNFSIVIDK